jgi:hypothetical protein
MKNTPFILISTFSASMAHSAILARWTPVAVASDPVVGADYDGGTATPSADEFAPNLTVSPLDRVGGAEFGGGNGGAVWPGLAIDGAAGISLPDYTNFTLTPDPGYVMALDTVTYSFQTYGLISPGGYQLYLRSSADGFAADLATTSIAEGTNGGTASFDASSLSGVSDATEFRIYASAPDGIAGNRWFDLAGDNTATDVGLIVNGTVAIPEPSSLFLSGLAGLLLTLRRRR